MKLDYISYVVAVICFLFAGIVFVTTFATNPPYLDPTIATVLTVVLAMLGLVLAGIGYSQRPKKATSLMSALPPESTAPATPPPVPTAPTPTTSIPTPKPEPVSQPTATIPAEETQKPQQEIKPKKKAVRKRRKKA